MPPFLRLFHRRASSLSCEIEEKLTAELARFAREGPPQADVDRMRNKIESDNLEALETISGIASTIQQVHHFYGGVEHLRDWSSRYSALTPDDIRGAVNRWLVTPSHLTIDVRPQNRRELGKPRNPTARLLRPSSRRSPFARRKFRRPRFPTGCRSSCLSATICRRSLSVFNSAKAAYPSPSTSPR